MKHLQIIGCILILVTTVLFFSGEAGLMGIGFIGIAGIEGFLVIKKKQTITQWYIPKLPKSIDMPIAIGVPIGIIYKLCNTDLTGETGGGLLIGGCVLVWIVSHLCSNEEVK